MKDQELEEILAHTVYKEGDGPNGSGGEWEYWNKGEVKPLREVLLLWRDKAVKEALLDFASRVGENLYEVDEYLKEQYQQELQDGK